MGALSKLSIVLGLAAVVGVYLYWLGGDGFFTPRLGETQLIALSPANKADSDEELDYLAARRIEAPEVWQAFLTDHPDGQYAPMARAELEKLGPGRSVPASADARIANDATSRAGTSDEELDYLAARRIGAPNVWRSFLTDHPDGQYAPMARAELEKLDAGRSVPALADAASHAGAAKETEASAPTSTATEATPPSADERCASDEERLSRLQANRSRDEAVRFANELSCEKLRPQLRAMIDDFSHSTPAPPAANGVASGDKPANAAAPTSASEGPSASGIAALGQKDESDCAAQRLRLDRLRAQPSVEPAQQLWRGLRCESLRPQVRLLLESLNAAADPPGNCERETEELRRIRAHPNRREAEGLVRDMTCDALKPQAMRLLESLAD
jgi:hypothetical protein